MLVIVSLLVLAVLIPGDEGVTITVTRDGKDHDQCLRGRTSCQTLGYALSAVTNGTSNITIHIQYDHQLTVKDTNQLQVFQGVTDIAIVGSPSPTEQFNTVITCPHLGTGLYFNQSTNITIRYISWINCGAWHPTTADANWTDCTAHSCHQLVSPRAVSALFMYNCTNLTLDHTLFTSNRGSGVSLYNVVGVVNITNCTFCNHTLEGVATCTNLNETTPPDTRCSPQATGLYIELTYCPNFDLPDCPIDNTSIVSKTEYNIVSCSFHDNHNEGAYRNITDTPTPMELNNIHHWPFGRGGAMGVALRVYMLKHFVMNIIANEFFDNSAVYGGGLYLMLHSGYPDRNYITMERNNFTSNIADYDGGGVAININVQYNTDVTTATLTDSLRNSLYIRDCYFKGNEGYWGGGMSFLAYPLNVSIYVHLQVVSCHFIENIYSGGGGAVALLRKEKPEKELLFVAKAEFYGCTFTNNVPVLARAYSRQILSSTVHSEGIEVSFFNVTTFADNCASALRLSDTGAVFHDIVTFRNNTGFNGGGVSLTGRSWITLGEGVTVEFVKNAAYRYGGAVYYNPAPVMNMNMTSSCFVWYEVWGSENVPVQEWNVSVTFNGNHASLAGDAAFVTDPQQCVWPNQLSLFNPQRTTIFDYSNQQQGYNNVVSTPAKYLSFNSTSHKYRRPSNSTDYARYRLMPGEGLDLQLVTIDTTSGLTSSLVCVTCYYFNDYENLNHQTDVCGKNMSFRVENQNRQLLSRSVLNYFKVYGPESNNTSTDPTPNDPTPNDPTPHDLVLVFKTDDPIPVILPLLISFRSCSNGFQYNNETRGCECQTNINADLSPVVCASNVDTVTPCVRHGYWYGKLRADHNMSVYHYCHNDRCRTNNHQDCDGYQGYKQLPVDDSELCARKGLQGPLCTQCAEGLDLTYNSYECVECTRGKVFGLSLLIVLECLAIVVVILVFVKLNVRISTAGFYGFLYFYSVISLLLWLPLPTGLDATLGIIVSVTSLDFQLLQYTGMCFTGFRAIHYEALHFVYPVAVMLMIFIVIKIDQSGLRRTQIFSGESSIQALCVILLITYTSLSETSLNILLPLQYQTPSNDSVSKWYVHVDPGLPYMDTREHLPYWLMAVAVEVLLVLPFSLLMITAPWVMRYVNLTKIKPILDEYHNCFHDNCRWFAGVYLLARQVIFFISILGQLPELASYLQQIFCLLLLLLVATLHPYRQNILNIVDVLLLSLLTFLSFTTSSSNGRRVYDDHNNIQYSVVGIVCIAPCCILVLFMMMTSMRSLCWRLRATKRFFKKPLAPVLSDGTFSNDDENSLTTTTTHSTMVRSTRDNRDDPLDDLPPRFYTQEQTHRNEHTPLLTATTGSRNRGVWPSTNHIPNPTSYSINNRPATN